MKRVKTIAIAAALIFATPAWAYRTARFTAKAPEQPSYDAAVYVGRALAKEIDAGRNRKANSFMRFQKCNVRRNGRHITINGMSIKEKFVYKGDDFVKVFEAVIAYSNNRCERDDD